MKETMKQIILAAAILCGTAHAAIPGIPSTNSTCALVGAIASATFVHQREGVSREQATKDIEKTLKEAMPTTGIPKYARRIIDATWKAAEQVPGGSEELAEARMTIACLEK